MNTVLYKNGCRYTEKTFKTEAYIEQLVVTNAKMLFGQKSIYIDAKKKIDHFALGGVIPDGFLFDLADKTSPGFYIVEVELSKHSFFNHIFPQITKFFAFFRNPDSQGKLVEKLYDIIIKDESLKTQLESLIGNREVFLFLKNTIKNSQNILIVIDNDKAELPQIIETYTDTWGKLVKVAILKEYHKQNDLSDTIISLSPDFENIENIDIVLPEPLDPSGDPSKPTTYTEEFHLNEVEENVKKLYEKLKAEMIVRIPNLIFNSQRYYISLRKKRNFAFLKIMRNKITIVAMQKEQIIREKIPNYNVNSLAESVQRFYNGECARIDFTDDSNIEEILNLLTEIQR